METSTFPTIFTKGNTFVSSCLLSLDEQAFQKRSTLKGKSLLLDTCMQFFSFKR